MNAENRPRRPTMTDVAAAAGVSQTTVSLVLNDALGARLSRQTRENVLAAADSLGYRLVRRKTVREPVSEEGVIAFVTDEIATDPWSAIALDGAQERAWENGLTVSMAMTRGDRDMEDAVEAQLSTLPLMGLIYAAIQTREVPPLPILKKVPTVLLNCYTADRSLASVVPGEFLGGYTATRRLVDAGHERIGHIQGEAWMDASVDRLKGYRRALTEADIPFDKTLVRPGNWEPSTGYEQTHELMRISAPPTAIFCANDLMAMGCYEALRELGHFIPEDIAVIGYDDREIAQFMRPPLTTILLPHFEMGFEAASLIIEQTLNWRRRPRQVKIECPLVERQSVGPVLPEAEANG